MKTFIKGYFTAGTISNGSLIQKLGQYISEQNKGHNNSENNCKENFFFPETETEKMELCARGIFVSGV